MRAVDSRGAVRVHVAIGGALGSVARVAADRVVAPVDGLLLTTFLVNVSGALALGVLLARTRDVRWRALLGTGVLGAWTTFSTLAVELDQLLRDAPPLAVAYLAVTLGAGLVAARVGRLAVEVTR
jgi:CrcB protein